MNAAQPTLHRPWLNRNAWLWWKEARMIAPLVMVLVAIGIFLLWIGTLSQARFYLGYGVSLQAVTPLIFPCLFAIGCGAVLVGQEREQRTIEWMSLLPLPPSHWMVVKFLVAFAGLAVMWAFAMLCFYGGDGGRHATWSLTGSFGDTTKVTLPIWIAQSVYLTFAGFYTSWRVADNFRALLWVLLFAAVPLVLCPTNASLMVLLVIASPLLAWMAYRTSQKTLQPQSAPVAGNSPAPVQRLVTANQAFVTGAWEPSVDLKSPSASMLWQFVRSAPLSLGLVAAMWIFGLTLPMLLFGSSPALWVSSLLLVLIAAAMLSASFLGVMVFQNDGSSGRLRFLADRGVSSSKVWWMRQAIPVAILTAGIIIYSLIASRLITSQGNSDIRFLLPSLLTLALISGGIYSVSQLTSQLFGTLTLAAVAGPILSIGLVGWLVYAYTVLMTPIWWLIVLLVLPMVASWYLMPRFMDGRGRLVCWGVGAAVMATWLVVPAVYFASIVAAQPSMATLPKSALLAEAKQIRQTATIDVTLSIQRRPNDIFETQMGRDDRRVPTDEATQWIASYPDRPEQFVQGLSELRERMSVSADASAGMNQDYAFDVLDRLIYQRLKFDADQDWQSFSPWVLATSEIVRALRNSPRWQDQDQADMFEIWLVEALTSASMQDHLNDEVVLVALANLPAAEARSASRRRAVLATWIGRSFQSGVVDNGVDQLPTYLAAWSRSRRMDAIVETALKAIDGDDQWRMRMHGLQADESTPFTAGVYSPRYMDLPGTSMIRRSANFPSLYWGERWETEVSRLKENEGESR